MSLTDKEIAEKAAHAIWNNSIFRRGHWHVARDAALAYDACARLLFGEHARLNFPRAGERSAHDAPLNIRAA